MILQLKMHVFNKTFIIINLCYRQVAEQDLQLCQDAPEVLQFVRVSVDKFWNAFERPHSGGRVPEKMLLGSSKCTKSESVPLEPQLAGRVPLRRGPPQFEGC